MQERHGKHGTMDCMPNKCFGLTAINGNLGAECTTALSRGRLSCRDQMYVQKFWGASPWVDGLAVRMAFRR